MNPINIEIQKKISFQEKSMLEKIVSSIKWHIFGSSIFTGCIGLYFMFTLFTRVKVDSEFSLTNTIFCFAIFFIGLYVVYMSSETYNRYYAYLLLLHMLINLVLLTSGFFTITPSYTFKKEMIDNVAEYRKSGDTKIDNVQLSLLCCGVSSKYEYLENKLPLSCCDEVNRNLKCSMALAHDKGCWDAYRDKLSTYKKISLTLISFSIIIQIAQVVCYSITIKKEDSS